MSKRLRDMSEEEKRCADIINKQRIAEKAKTHIRPVAEASYWYGYVNGLAAAASLIEHEDEP